MANRRINCHKNLSLFEAKLLLYDPCWIPDVSLKLWTIVLVLTTHFKISSNLLGSYCMRIYFRKYSSEIPYRNLNSQPSFVLRI